MAVVSKPEIISAESLLALGEDAAVEVVKGRLVEMGPAGAKHGEVAGNILGSLWAYVRGQKLGKVFSDQTTYVLEGTPDDIRTMRVPDISFIAADNLPDETPTGYWFQPPDLVIEIVSPSEKAADIQAKLTDYFKAGTREAWVVYPEQAQLVVHWKDSSKVLAGGDTLTSEELLPGFALKLSEVFE